jgi:quinol monooxygenase YgiN
MRAMFGILLAAVLLPGGVVRTASAQDAAVYVATYVEVAPAAAGQAIALIKELGTATRAEDGNLRFQAVQERGRPNRFVAIEAWKDQKAFEAHGKAAPVTAFRQKLGAISNAPYDERVNGPLVAAAGLPAPARGAVWVVTHVDVPGTFKDSCVALLSTLAEDSRKDSGNLMFEVVQQTNRPNHFTVVEVWKNAKAYDAHGMAASTRQFREKLGPMVGALYDERLYKAIE